MIELHIATLSSDAGRIYAPHILRADADTITVLTGSGVDYALRAKIERMAFDDALRFEAQAGVETVTWRLEYCRLNIGLPHYRLFRGDELLGLVDVTSPRMLHAVQRYLTRLLSSYGWQAHATTHRICGVHTLPTAGKRRVPVLFKVQVPSNPKRQPARVTALIPTS